MTRFIRRGFYAMFAFVICSCGLATNTADMLLEVKKSNGMQERLAEYIQQTKNLTAEIERLNSEIAYGIHLQTLSLALAGMFAPENTEVLSPVPFGMMPYAETYAHEATEEELIRTIDLLLKRVYFTPNSYPKVRQVSLMAMGLLSSFAEDDKVNAIFSDNIKRPGLYEEASGVLGVCRYHFTRDYLLIPIYENSDLQNVNTLRKGVYYFERMTELVRSPYAKHFVFALPSLGIDMWTVNIEDLRLVGSRAEHKFSQKLTGTEVQTLEVKKLLKKFDV